MAIVTVGFNLTKNHLAAHRVNEAGKPALVRPGGLRAKLVELIASPSDFVAVHAAACARRGTQNDLRELPLYRDGFAPALSAM